MPSNVEAGKAYVTLSLKDSAASGGFDRWSAKLRAFGVAVEGIGQRTAAVGLVLSSAFAGAAKLYGSTGDALHKMSQRTGIAAESLSALDFAANRSGTSLDTVEKAVRKMQAQLGDAAAGTDAAAEAFAQLGLNADEVARLAPEDQFKLIADRIAAIQDPSERAAAAMDVFGKSGTDLLPLLADGAKGIEDLQDQARAFGLTVSNEAASRAAVLNDALGDMTSQAKRLVVEIGAALAPSAQKLAERFRQAAQDAAKWIGENKEAVTTAAQLALKVLAAGVALTVVGKALTIVSGGLKAVAVSLAIANSAFHVLAAHPVLTALGLISAGLTGLIINLANAEAGIKRLNAAAAELVATGKQQRNADQLRAERLEQLAKKQELTNAEQTEAAELVADLERRYGALGVSVDQAAGRIEGMAGALDKLAAAMQRQAVTQLDQQIITLETHLDSARQKVEAFRAAAAGNPAAGGAAADTALQAQIEKAKELEAELAKVREQRAAAAAGDKAALFGQQEAADLQAKVAQGRLDDAEAAERVLAIRNAAADAEKRLADIEAQAARSRQSALENELDGIRERKAEQLELIGILEKAERARVGGPRPERLAELDAKRADVSINAAADQEAALNRQADIEAENAAELAKIRGDFEKQTAEDIARARIDLMNDETARRLALLELEKAAAIDAAKEVGAGLAGVNELFELRRQAIVDGARQVGATARGTFNAAAVQGLQSGPIEKVVEQQREANRELKGIKRGIDVIADQGGAVFA